MAVGLFEPWRVPIGYFLTRGGLSSEQQSELVKEALTRLAKSGVQVRAVIFDGTSANIGTVTLLGASLPDSPNFKHPSTPDADVQVVLDNCHMLKLARNCFAKNALMNEFGEPIRFVFC